MHKDFHLYGTYMAAKNAGYDCNDAALIACAAQMVDEFGKGLIDENITVTPMISEVIKSVFSSKIEDEIADIWVPFHFIPKNKPNSIRESEFKKYQCGYGENVIKKIIETMQQNQDTSLEQIGVLMHVLADSFAHKEFCGKPCKDYNTITKVNCYMLSKAIGLENAEYVPAHLPYQAYFGHGCVGHLPDLSWVQYEYTWASGEIGVRNNPEIFAEAYKTMVNELRRFNSNGSNEQYNNLYDHISTDLQEKAFEKQKDSYNVLMKNRAINSANQLFMQEVSSSSDLKGKVQAINDKLKNIRYDYEQVEQDDKGNYIIKRVEDTAFNLYTQKPVTVGAFNEESDNLFELICDNSEELKSAYENYRKNIQDKNSDQYKNFKNAATQYKNLYNIEINKE